MSGRRKGFPERSQNHVRVKEAWEIKLSCKEDIFCEKQGKETQEAQKVDLLKIV